MVYFCSFGFCLIQRVAADFTEKTPVENVAEIPAIGTPAERNMGNPDGRATW